MTMPKTVLLIDDDAGILEMLTELLTQAGFTVRAGYGDSALESALNNPPDAIILDLLQPGDRGMFATVGEHILYVLKHNSDLAHIPVIVTTAFPEKTELVLAMGAFRVRTKPFGINDILRAVVDAIGLPPATNEGPPAAPHAVATAQDAVTQAVADAQVAVSAAVDVAVETAAIAEAAVDRVKIAVEAEQHAQHDAKE